MNVYIYCEGQTEESFIKKVLTPYFSNMDIFVTPIICTTKVSGNIRYKGGALSYDKIKKELRSICKNKSALVTTMFDYYGMPNDTPNIEDSAPDIYQRIENIERSVEHDIGESNLLFGLMLHEFEAVLFSEPDAFGCVAKEKIVNEISNVRNKFQTPEHINNSVDTAPSKRLAKIIPNYSKVTNGTLVSQKIGIGKIIRECAHFSHWINRIKEKNS